MIQSLYASWSLPFLGHAVSILLNLAEKEKSRALKIKAMECLIEISQVDGKCKSRKIHELEKNSRHQSYT